MFGVVRPGLGVCSSPLVEGNRVLVSVGGKGTSVVAFDTDTGRVAWKALDGPASTSSPVVLTHTLRPGELQRQAVFVNGRGVFGLNPADGAVAWEHPLADLTLGVSPTPLCAGDLVLTTSMKYGTVGTRLTSKGEKLVARPEWKNPDLRGYFSTPLLAGKNQVYLLTSVIMPEPRSTLRCVDVKTGKELWNKPNIADYHVGLVRTGDDKLLLLTDHGILKLLDPSPKGYRELASAKVCGPSFVAPALSNGRLYVRDDKAVICLHVGQ
jgi:outer membrane protein assembly factor BamB